MKAYDGTGGTVALIHNLITLWRQNYKLCHGSCVPVYISRLTAFFCYTSTGAFEWYLNGISPTTVSTNQLNTCALIHYWYMCEYIYSQHCSNNHTRNKHYSYERAWQKFLCTIQMAFHRRRQPDYIVLIVQQRQMGNGELVGLNYAVRGGKPESLCPPSIPHETIWNWTWGWRLTIRAIIQLTFNTIPT